MANKKIEKIEDSGKKTCFVIMPFSDPEGYAPGHFRKIYEHIFAPAIKEAGYEPLRIDDNSVSNLIHSKMINELANAPMALCDLSTNNPNVLYELGIRHAFDLPVVLVQEIGQDRIFDVGGITSVGYHPARVYEDVIEDRGKITKAIRETTNAKNKYSIMSLVALHAAKPTSDELVTREDRVEFLLQDMSRKINGLEKRIADQQQSGKEPVYADLRNSSRENAKKSLLKMMDDIESDIELIELLGLDISIEEVDYYERTLSRKLRECVDAGAGRGELVHAESLLDRLSELRTKLRNKERDALPSVSA